MLQVFVNTTCGVDKHREFFFFFLLGACLCIVGICSVIPSLSLSSFVFYSCNNKKKKTSADKLGEYEDFLAKVPLFGKKPNPQMIPNSLSCSCSLSLSLPT